ncbi:hypothetical protein [uncultured Cocleimonas sp.]|uniref:hypothetical protein n=1 Tax=uncultured Cocleimonas sp. TaxID=1051587 RepID=UPI0026074FC7|nr:hypothetical protein [uncultured Cocleimonas sp.]
MEDYSKITDKLNSLSREIHAFEATYLRFTSELIRHYSSGSIPTVRDLSFSITDQNVIKVEFAGFNFEIDYEFKRENETPKGLLNVHLITEGEEQVRSLITTQEFEVDGSITGTSLYLHNDMGCITILLNLIESSI